MSKPHGAHLLSLLAGFYAITNTDSVVSLAEKAVTAAPDDSDVHYRVAVAYDLVGKRERALKHLARSFDLGHSVQQIEAEPFLAELRKDPRYKILLGGVMRPTPDCDPVSLVRQNW